MAVYTIGGERYNIPDDVQGDQLNNVISEIAKQYVTPAIPEEEQSYLQNLADQPFGSGDAMRSATQGLTFGWGDEIESLGLARDAVQAEGGNFWDKYSEAHTLLNDRMTRYGNENPYSSTALEVAGSLPTAAVGAVANSGRLGLAASGAVQGALYGAGTAQQGERLTGTAEVGILGAVGAPATSIALNRFGSVVGKISDFIKRKFSSTYDQQQGQRVLANWAQKMGISSPEDVQRVVDKMDQYGEEAVLADIPEFQNLADATALRPTEGSNTIAGMLYERQVQAQDRLLGSLAEGSGVERDLNLTQWVDDLATKRADDAAPLYERAFAKDIDETAEIKSLKSSPAFMAAMKKAEELAANETTAFSGGLTNIRKFDYVKRALDDMIDGAPRNEARVLRGVKNRLVSELDRQVPDYRAARNVFADSISLEKAAERGQSILKEDADEIGAIVANMTDGEKEAFRIGAAKSIKDKLTSKAETQSPTTSLNSSLIRDRLRPAFKSESEYQSFIKDLDRENTFRSTYQRVLGNSATARRQQATAALDAASEGQPLPEALIQAGNPKAALASEIITKVFGKKGVSDEAVNEVADFLTKKGVTVEELQKVVTRKEPVLTAREFSDAAGSVAVPIGGALSE